MTASLKLTRGAASFDLMANGYSVGLDFAPPAVNMSYNVTSGTSANVSEGGSLISQRANDRQFGFNVRLLVSNLTDAKAKMNALTSFTRARSNDVMYLEYRENSALLVPLWGQLGAPARYEIITCDVGNVSGGYTETGRGFTVTISLLIKPLAIGNKQKLINAQGGIFENNYGSADGSSQGLRLFEATTNKAINPVFGHSTWNNGWTAEANVIESQNTDLAFCLPGLTSSAKVSSKGSTNNSYYRLINAGNTNKHTLTVWVYLPDKGTPTTADFDVVYSTALATTYVNLGNGLWMAYANNITGINSAQAAGIQIKSGHTVYLLAIQFEERVYASPLCYGDLLGCAWTGAVHGSTSTRTYPQLLSPDVTSLINPASGAIAMVWKSWFSSGYPVDTDFWMSLDNAQTSPGLHGYRTNADHKFSLTDGTNTISSAAQTYADFETVYMLFTWGPGGLNIYRNGVNIATGATFTPTVASKLVYFNIGGNVSPGAADGDIVGFDTYATELTAAQALAIYTAQAAIVAGGNRVSSIPWLYTSTGTGVVYNHDDSGHDNWAVAGGIPGSVDGTSKIEIATSINNAGYDAVYISNLVTPQASFLTPEFLTYNGAPDAITVDTNQSTIYSLALTVAQANLLYGKQIIGMVRGKDAVGAFTMATGILTPGDTGLSLYLSVNFGTGASTYIDTSPDTQFPQDTFIIPSNIVVYGKRSTGSNTFTLTSVQFIIRPVVKIVTVPPGNSVTLTLDGQKTYKNNGSTQHDGDREINLFPNTNNSLIFNKGFEAVASDPAQTMTMTITITPRYSLA